MCGMSAGPAPYNAGMMERSKRFVAWRGVRRRAAAAALALSTAACGGIGGGLVGREPGPASGGAAGGPVTIKVIAFNDFHGHLEQPPGALPVHDPASGRTVRVPTGGVARLATLVGSLKAANPNHVVVAAGDLIGATPFVSAQFSDEPTIELLSRIGLEVSSVGNHEFDKGRAELLRIVGGGCRPRSADGRVGRPGVDTCAQDGRYEGAGFRYLAANVVDAASGKPLLPAVWTKRFGAVGLGFVGVTLRDTPTVVSPAGVRGLRFEDEAQAINAQVPALLEQGVAAVVALVHQGGRTSARHVGDPSCPGLSGDIVDIADRLHPAVRVIVSGHTHREYVCERGGRLITQAGAEGRMVTDIELTIDPAGRRVLAQRAQTRVVVAGPPLPEADRPVPPPPAGLAVVPPAADIERRVQIYVTLAAPAKDVVVGRITSTIHRRPNAAGETEIGNLVADAYLLEGDGGGGGEGGGTGTGSSPGAPASPPRIALTNPGGLRTELAFDLASDGRVTRGMLFSVMPFNNRLVSMDLTGAQLLRLLEQQWEQPQPAGGRVLQVSRGLRYQWSRQAPEGAPPGQGRRVVPGSVSVEGEPLRPERVYRVTVNDFMASGGDNFSVFLEGRNRQVGERDIDRVQALFQATSPLAPPPLGRILVQ